MDDETQVRPGGKDHSGNADGIGSEQHSPLQGRAAFIQNWNWELVVGLNRGACERGKAQHGYNSETHGKVQGRWEKRQKEELTLGQLLDFLLQCHRSAPFLFFNGNTFGEIARRVVDAVFIEFPIGRRREAASVSAHYVAGVLDRDALVSGLNSLAKLSQFKAGDRIKTLRGSAQGVVVRIMKDGRIVWKPNRSTAELIALPESLVKEERI
jgi:hypothetical protein